MSRTSQKIKTEMVKFRKKNHSHLSYIQKSTIRLYYCVQLSSTSFKNDVVHKPEKHIHKPTETDTNMFIGSCYHIQEKCNVRH